VTELATGATETEAPTMLAVAVTAQIDPIAGGTATLAGSPLQVVLHAGSMLRTDQRGRDRPGHADQSGQGCQSDAGRPHHHRG
jgi:hypothetical protein